MSVMPSRHQPNRFVVRTKDGNSRKFETPTPALRDEWVAALRWMMEKSSLVSGPTGVVHVTHVSQDMDWSALHSESLEKEFVLGTMIGYGAFGQVYKGVHKASGHVLAIKTCVVDTLVLSTEEIRVEADSMKAVKHANIVNYFGCWGPDPNARLWMLMEFCEGGSVIDTCEKHKIQLTERQVSFVCYSVLLALAYLQRQKILHRDIKGRNILLCANGAIKLTDFGVAKKVVGGAVSDEEAAGTPHWMGPELLDNSKVPRSELFKADIWSLGITAIELAEGQPPLNDLNRKKLTDAILKNPAPTLKNQDAWSPAFHDFVRWCLVKEFPYRPSATLLLQHPFIARAASLAPAELMASVLFPALYAGPAKKSDAKTPKEVETDAFKRDKKAMEKVYQTQLKKEPELAKQWRNEVKQAQLDGFAELVKTTMAEDERKRQLILATRPRFTAVVTYSGTTFSIASKIFSPSEIDDNTSYQVTRKIADFEWLISELKRVYKHRCLPSLNPALGFTDQIANCQWLLDFLAVSDAIKGDLTVMAFLSETEVSWKSHQDSLKDARAEIAKLEKYFDTKVKLDNPPVSPAPALLEKLEKLDTLTQTWLLRLHELATDQQAVSRCWLMLSGGGVSRPSGGGNRDSTALPLTPTTTIFMPLSPSLNAAPSTPTPPPMSRKQSITQGLRRLTTNGRQGSSSSTATTPSASPRTSTAQPPTPGWFDVDESVFKMIQPLALVMNEAPTIGVFHLRLSERLQKVCEPLEQQVKVTKCLEDTCKRAESTHNAYCGLQANRKKAAGFEQAVTVAWNDLKTTLPEEARAFNDKRRAESIAAIRAYATEAIAVHKKKTAALIQLLVEMKKLDRLDLD